MLYPVDLGAPEEVGEAAGSGFNVNVPLPAGSGFGAYELAIERVVVPALHAFRPDLIVIACGFDAAYFDPLSHMLLLADHFRALTRTLRHAADQLCDGRIVLNHEGGYSDFYVPLCGVAAIEELSGISSGVRDPYASYATVPNQRLMPHQADVIDRAVDGPLAALLASS